MEEMDTRHNWDPNVQDAKIIKEFNDDGVFAYMKTKKVAVVSSRDQYLFIHRRTTSTCPQFPGKRVYILACKSKNLSAYPETPNCVRAQTLISGTMIVEEEPGKL